MFENLTEKFNSIFKNLKGLGKITDENINQSVKDVKLALLEADVNYKVVKQFVDDVKQKAMGKDVLHSIMPEQQFVKIVNDELIALMKSSHSELIESKESLVIVMLVGLQGSGKTTVAAKLAHYLKHKQRKRVMLAACDLERPAAIKQLKILAESCGVDCYTNEHIKDPSKIAEEAVGVARNSRAHYLIVDTAGRLDVDEPLMDELKAIKCSVKPNEVLYVADAMMGQIAVDVAKKFDDVVGLNGVVISKLDGDARGGVALSIKSVIGVPIKFVGIGETLTDLELFYPDRMASRILGMGDVVGLVEKVHQNVSEEHARKIEQKIKKNELDFNDFLSQIKQIKKMGPLKDILAMIPGISSKLNALPVDEKQFVRLEAIICSMTKHERLFPNIINGKRRMRIAKGSGTRVQDVNQLLKQFSSMRKMLKQFSSGKHKNMMNLFNN